MILVAAPANDKKRPFSFGTLSSAQAAFCRSVGLVGTGQQTSRLSSGLSRIAGGTGIGTWPVTRPPPEPAAVNRV